MSEMDFVSAEKSLWFLQRPEDGAKSLYALSEAADADNTVRRGAASYNASVLDGLGLPGFGAWAYGKQSGAARIGSGSGACPLVWNYAASGLDTLQAKVVGREEPKPMIEVTDGTWEDQIQAVWSSRLLEGLYRGQQGKFHDVWDLGRHAFKIAAGVTGSVAVKVLPYHDEDKIVCELHDTLDMFIDHFECTYSNPLTYGEITWFDAHRLMAIFDKPAQKQAIWAAREPLPTDRGGMDGEKTRYMVKLVEGWRLKLGKTAGRYLATIKGGEVLQKGDYEHDTPPFAFLHARRSLGGFYGIPVMERGMRIVERINQILAAMDKGERLVPKNLLIYDIRATPKELMKNVRDVMQVGWNSEIGGQPPQWHTPPIYDQTVMQLLEAHIQAFHETLGISSAQMSAQKQPGIVAAAAVRTVNDMFTQLFSVISRDYTKFLTTDLGSLHLRAVNDMVKTDPSFGATWDSGNGTRKKIKGKIADLKNKSFTMGVYPVSEARNTPADRISMADEMLSRKELSPEAYQRVIATGDLPRETKAQDTQYTMIERAIDSWMHDEFDEIENTSPLPWMNHANAIVQVLEGYMQVLMTPKFDPNRELYFRRYITQSDIYLKRQLLERAQLEATAGGQAAPMPAAQPIAAE